MSEKYDRDPSVPTSPRVRARALSATVAVVLRCTCKHGCLKMYCQCRARGVACDPARAAAHCTNTVASKPAEVPVGCHRVRCLKKYCVCFA